MEDYCKWVLIVEYSNDYYENTRFFEAPYATKEECDNALNRLVNTIAKANRAGNNVEGLCLVGATIKFEEEVDDKLLQGSLSYDIRREK